MLLQAVKINESLTWQSSCWKEGNPLWMFHTPLLLHKHSIHIYLAGIGRNMIYFSQWLNIYLLKSVNILLLVTGVEIWHFHKCYLCQNIMSDTVPTSQSPGPQTSEINLSHKDTPNVVLEIYLWPMFQWSWKLGLMTPYTPHFGD